MSDCEPSDDEHDEIEINEDFQNQSGVSLTALIEDYMKGGATDEKLELTTAQIETPKSFKTRPTMTIFEFVRALTKGAKFLFSVKDLAELLEEIEIKSIIFPCACAFRLFEKGKFNAIFDRGIEKVAYSNLEINPEWKEICEEYFNEQEESVQNQIFKYFDEEKKKTTETN